MGIHNVKSSENIILRIINGFDVIDYPSNGNERKNLYVLSTGAGLGMAACDLIFPKYSTGSASWRALTITPKVPVWA